VNVGGAMAAISGSMKVCASSITTLSDPTGGGTWSLSSSLVASIGSASGTVTASGSYTGTTTVSYSTGSCVATGILTVNANPAPVQGASSECAGITITLSDVTIGGTWSVSNSNVSITGTGGVMGLVAGTSTITYTAGTGCYVTYPNTIHQDHRYF
jgi:hypothetical protein